MYSDLETEFRDELYELYKKTCDELYYPSTFWVALGQENWLQYIKNFINAADTDGIKKLINARRPDLSFEYIIVNNQKYQPLFTNDEIDRCKQTLDFMTDCIEKGVTL